jgi:hypothetical protein
MGTAENAGRVMKGWLKRLRAAVTLGGFWGAASGAGAAACHGLFQVLGRELSLGLILQSGLEYGVAGWLVGTAFAGTLIHFENRGILVGMRPWRIAVWGALMGGVLAPLVLTMLGGPSLLGLPLVGLAGLGAGVGSLLSTATLKVAEGVSRELDAAGTAELLREGGDADLVPGEP